MPLGLSLLGCLLEQTALFQGGDAAALSPDLRVCASDAGLPEFLSWEESRGTPSFIPGAGTCSKMRFCHVSWVAWTGHDPKLGRRLPPSPPRSHTLIMRPETNL